MAIRYVSNSADNGYTLGVDAPGGLTKATAWLTLDYALTNAAIGDQIILNGGAGPAFLIAPSGGLNVYTAATFFNIAKQLDLIGDNFPTLKRTGAVTRVLNINIQATVNVQDVILDGENTASLSALTISSQVGRFTVNITGVKAINTPIYSINSSAALCDLNVRRCNLTSVRGGVKSVALTTGSYIITDNVITATGIQANEAAIMTDAGATGITMFVSDNIVNQTSASNNAHGIRSNNVRGIVQRNRVRTAGSFVTCAGIYIGTNGAILAEKPLVRWNYITHGCFNGGAAGWGILIGSDGDGADTANDNQINRPIVYGNVVVGSYGASTPLLHGIEVGHVVGGNVGFNIVVGAGIGVLAKRTTGDLYLTGNTLAQPLASTSGCVRTKGAQNVIASGNCILVTNAAGNHAILNNSEPTVPAQDSLNNSFIGNTISAPWQATRVVSSAASSTAEFMMNDYDLPLGVSGASPFSYNGVNYASLAAWGAAQEATFQNLPAGAADREFWNKIGFRPGGRGVLPPSGVAPAWGA